jgi:cytochrome c peroxidase
MNTKTPRSSRARLLTVTLLASAAAFAGAGLRPNDDRPEPPAIPLEVLDSLRPLPGDLGVLPLVVWPKDNPSSPEKIALGKKLFFDNRLSGDNSMSCATCHSPEKGFADGKPLAIGFGNKVLGRHTPTVLNAAYNDPQFWDGRAHGLEAQAQGPIMAEGEMNMGGEAVLVDRLKKNATYKVMFDEVFGAEPTLELVGKAIAAYERTIVTPNSPFDRYVAGERTALSDSEKRGLLLFIGKASCTQCHSGPNFTDNKYHNLGVHKSGAEGGPDVGRFAVTKDEADRGAFKTPTVREALVTAPYMHDGSVDTLEALVDFYNKGGGEGPNKSKLLFPLNLTPEEKKDLVAFMKALSGTIGEPWNNVAGAEGDRGGND